VIYLINAQAYDSTHRPAVDLQAPDAKDEGLIQLNHSGETQ
jgi:hypothetical protein